MSWKSILCSNILTKLVLYQEKELKLEVVKQVL